MAYVAVGGTFDPLHNGHKVLLIKACELSRNGKLIVGLTSDEMVKKKAHYVRDYQSRYNDIMRFVLTQGVIPSIVKLDDPYGPAVSDNFDYLVVSPETHSIALNINKMRKEKGLKQIKIVVVDYVLAENGLPVSSTRIKKWEIDEQGKIL